MAETKSTERAATNQRPTNAKAPLHARVPLATIRRLLNLEPVASQVFLALAFRADFRTCDCFPSIATIAQDTGRHEDTVRAAIKALKAAGIVSIERRMHDNGTCNVNRYVLALVPAREGVPESQGVPEYEGVPEPGGVGVPESQGAGVPERQGEELFPINNAPIERKKSARFEPPTVEQVAAYCSERRDAGKANSINPEQFVAYYAAQGWRLKSGRPMCDWKAAVVNWETQSKERAKKDGTRDARVSGRFTR